MKVVDDELSNTDAIKEEEITEVKKEITKKKKQEIKENVKKEEIIELKEEADEEESVLAEDSNETVDNDKKINKKVILISAISIVAFLIVALLSTGFALLNISNSGIMTGVTINGIELRGLNKEQAIQRMTEVFNKALEKEITLQIGELEYSIFPFQLEAGYNITSAIDDAYSIGRNSNIFANNFQIMKSMITGKEINAELIYDETLLDEIVLDIIAKMPDVVIEPNYYKEGDKLIITKGKSGNTIDKEKTKELILNKIKNNDGKKITVEMIFIEASRIDIDKIYTEVYKEPQDAYYIEEPFEIIAHVEGVDFDLEAARELLKEDKEEYEIPLIITMPEIPTSKIGTEAFPNLLSRFSTKYDASVAGRSSNLKLAAEKLDGVIVMPGEEFSYNRTLGERTISAGYREALGYIGGKVVPTLGGGICQISSTLYNAVIKANLEIVERRNHMFQTSYVGPGKDATVAYGSIDFRFRNTRQYPIMIKAEVGNGVATIDIFGIFEEVEYQVDLETTIIYNTAWKIIYENDSSLRPGQEVVAQGGMSGCKSITYRVTRLNGMEISREVVSTDVYDPMNKIILRGPEVSQPVTQEPIPETPVTNNPDPDPVTTPNPGDSSTDPGTTPDPGTDPNNEPNIEP